LICEPFSPIVVFAYHITNLAEEQCLVNAPDAVKGPLFTPPMLAQFDPEQEIRASLHEHAGSGEIE
jgi:hypothetical protein